MFRSPKLSPFRPWALPSRLKKTNGGGPRSPSLPDEEERQLNIKLAVFFSVVALLFVLAEHLGRMQEETNANLASDSTASVSLSLLAPERSPGGPDFSVRFRLSNAANHAVFYPMNTATNSPIGQLVGRASPAADWTSLADSSNELVPPVQNTRDPNLTWIEMPPGGWVEGKFSDTGKSPIEHAYVIYVKPTRDSNAIRIVSNSYRALPN